jgi:hypothetical protein
MPPARGILFVVALRLVQRVGARLFEFNAIIVGCCRVAVKIGDSE